MCPCKTCEKQSWFSVCVSHWISIAMKIHLSCDNIDTLTSMSNNFYWGACAWFIAQKMEARAKMRIMHQDRGSPPKRALTEADLKKYTPDFKAMALEVADAGDSQEELGTHRNWSVHRFLCRSADYSRLRLALKITPKNHKKRSHWRKSGARSFLLIGPYL